ncbi:MAG TPA: Dps family protein [Xenococcaceae cyanobacterium]
MNLIRQIFLIIILCCCWFTDHGSAIAEDLSIYQNPLAQERILLKPQNRDVATTALQHTLVELIDLTLSTKQAHWNLNGPLFYTLHQLLDEFVEDYRDNADMVAERMLAIGHTADGRPRVVSNTAELPTFPEGYISDYKVVDLLSQRLDTVGNRIRDRITQLDKIDLVSQDVLIDLERDIAKQLWMLREFQQQTNTSFQAKS